MNAAAGTGMAPASRTHRHHHEGSATPPPPAASGARTHTTPAPPPRWLTLMATLGMAALHLSAQRGAQAQVYEWNGISVKQYVAQEHYDTWQKDDETYSSWAYRNVRASSAAAAAAAAASRTGRSE